MLLILEFYLMCLEESNNKALADTYEGILELSPPFIEMLLYTASEIEKVIQQG